MAELSLTEDDATELAATTFTPLDAHHLETCLLLRDAAASLEVTAADGKGKTERMTPLERAEAGFAWACRQIRLPRATLTATAPS